MHLRSLLTPLALAGFHPHSATAANYAASVVNYTAGTGAAAGYDQSASILGEPSRVTPGEFGGPVDPFSGPWQMDQLLSVGLGGSVTVRFADPVFNHPGNPFGVDFLVFGGAAFLITNGDFTGGGITDGSLFGNNTGGTRVSVSVDGVTFYTLDPALAPTVDGLFPTDGTGDFSRPVDPSLAAGDFSGLGLDGIRSLYAGSGGGTGFDLAWAHDAGGSAVSLDRIEFVRLDVLGDRAEIDALSAVPEPRAKTLLFVGAGGTRDGVDPFARARRNAMRTAGGKSALAVWDDFSFVLPVAVLLMAFRGHAATFHEGFAQDPVARSWAVHGDASLFGWDPQTERLQVTWDSARTNSFYHRPLGTIVTRLEDFRFAFSLVLDELQTTSSDGTFQLALGFIRQTDAFQTSFFRGAGVHPQWGPRNLLEFDYFPASRTITPTLSVVAVATNNTRWAMANLFPFRLEPGARYDVTVSFRAADQSLALQVQHEGETFASGVTMLGESFGDFRADAFSITSYSGEHQPAGYGGGILARGWVDDIEIEVPDAPRASLALSLLPNAAQIEAAMIAGWTPVLERSVDLFAWSIVAGEPANVGDRWIFTDSSLPRDRAIYRVQLLRP